MAMIDVSGLSFCYDGSYEPVFEDVSLRLDTGWKLGFVGRNGRGKTTFLKLLQGNLEYRGQITSPVRFAYFPYEVEDTTALSGDIAAAVCGEAGCEEWEFLCELSLLNVSEEALTRPYDTLSGGEQTKLLLAALFAGERRFLLIDEPTNHLDAEARRLVGDYLAAKHGFILVSHDRAFLDRCVDHMLAVNRTTVEIQRGNFSSWWENRERLNAFEAAENEKLRGEITRLSAAARRTSGWSDSIERSKIGTHAADRGYIGHKSAKMMKRAKSIEARRQKAAEDKSALLKDVEKAEELILRPLEYRSPVLIRAESLGVSFDGRAVLDGIGFSVERGERIALCGKNGSGKTTLLHLMSGRDIPYSGTLSIGSGLVISVVCQDTSFLAGSLRDFIRASDIDESLFKTILRKLDFTRAHFELDMSRYSQGQRKKVLIARSLCERAHLYLWDEPLNYIDVISRMQIEELLKTYAPTMVFVEHDEVFCETVATRRIRL